MERELTRKRGEAIGEIGTYRAKLDDEIQELSDQIYSLYKPLLQQARDQKVKLKQAIEKYEKKD